VSTQSFQTRLELFTLPEVAAIMKVSRTTVYRLALDGKLPGFKIGGQWRFSEAQLIKYLGTVASPSPSPEIPETEDEPEM